MKKYAVIIVLAVVTAFGFTPVPGGKKQNLQKMSPQQRIVEKLNLTDGQLSQFNDIRTNHQKSVIDIKADIQKNRLEVKKMMLDNDINADKLIQLTETNNDLRSKIHTSKVNMWLDVYDILDDAQKKTWAQHFAKLGNKMGKKAGRGMGKYQSERRMGR